MHPTITAKTTDNTLFCLLIFCSLDWGFVEGRPVKNEIRFKSFAGEVDSESSAEGHDVSSLYGFAHGSSEGLASRQHNVAPARRFPHFGLLTRSFAAGNLNGYPRALLRCARKTVNHPFDTQSIFKIRKRLLETTNRPEKMCDLDHF
jgi:hypothetical protein